MKKTIAVVLALVAGTALLFAAGNKDAASTSSASKLSGTYTFGGSTTVQPIANVAIEQFTKENTGVKISYEGVGSGTGIKQLGEGTLSLAGSSRELKQAELDLGLVPVVIARDAITAVVNKDVSVANLSKDQLAGIYSGTITNWKDVGGKDEAIVVVNRDETSGTYSSFKELVLDPKKVAFTKNAIVSKENGEVAAKVGSTPGAIGYVGLGYVEEIVKAGGKALSIDGILPSVETTLDKTYGLSRDLFMVTKGAAKAGSVEKAFIDYVLSARGKIIIKEAGFVPLK
jgi:phosphate transport system substrate-binding protein